MGILTGYLCCICLVLLFARCIKNQKLHHALAKLHKPVSCIFLLLCVMHIVFVFPVLNTRSVWVIASGLAGIGIAVLLTVLCHIMADRKKRIIWHRALSVVLAFLVAAHIVAYLIDFAQYQNNIQAIEVTEADLSVIADGTYTGECDVGYIYAKVRVTVKGGQITGIEILEHRNERGQRAEEIAACIIARQSLNVDAVSGATNSSLVIKKACENALRP